VNKYICSECGGAQYTKTDEAFDCIHCGNKETVKVDITDDEELYFKIRRLWLDENCIGIFCRGHADMEQWKRVAKNFMKVEYGIESDYLEFRKGWYKVLPNRKMALLDRRVRGSFPAMECVYR